MIIETERLVLRLPCAEDWPAAEHFLTCPETMQHLGGVQHPADAWRTFAGWLGAWQLTDAGMFAVVEKASGEWIGRVGPWYPLHWPVREVGWGLRRPWWGRGFALEAAKAAIQHAYDVLGWDTVSHLIHDRNVASQHLAEKLGSKPAGRVELPGSLGGYEVTVWQQARDSVLAPMD